MELSHRCADNKRTITLIEEEELATRNFVRMAEEETKREKEKTECLRIEKKAEVEKKEIEAKKSIEIKSIEANIKSIEANKEIEIKKLDLELRKIELEIEKERTKQKEYEECEVSEAAQNVLNQLRGARAQDRGTRMNRDRFITLTNDRFLIEQQVQG